MLAKPGVVLAWGFKTEGIDVVMPTADERGTWTGWWEGIVDLTPMRGRGSRDFSISKLFQQPMPRAFPAASSSVLRVIRPREGDKFREEPAPQSTKTRWVDGRLRSVDEWDLTRGEMAGQDMRFWWNGEGDFEHRMLKTQGPR